MWQRICLGQAGWAEPLAGHPSWLPPGIATARAEPHVFAETPEPAQAIRDEIGAMAAQREAVPPESQRVGQLCGSHWSDLAQDSDRGTAMFDGAR